MSKQRIDWFGTPAVLTSKVLCPHCLSGDGYDRVRTDRRADGGATKRCKCRACGGAYRITEEFPVSGNLTVWPNN